MFVITLKCVNILNFSAKIPLYASADYVQRSAVVNIVKA